MIAPDHPLLAAMGRRRDAFPSSRGLVAGELLRLLPDPHEGLSIAGLHLLGKHLLEVNGTPRFADTVAGIAGLGDITASMAVREVAVSTFTATSRSLRYLTRTMEAFLRRHGADSCAALQEEMWRSWSAYAHAVARGEAPPQHVADVALEAVLHFHGYVMREENGLRAPWWSLLRTITWRRAKDCHRKVKTAAKLGANAQAVRDRRAAAALQRNRVRAALEKLEPELQRAAEIVLGEQKGTVNIEELAERLGVTRAQAARMWHHLICALRTLLDPDLDAPWIEDEVRASLDPVSRQVLELSEEGYDYETIARRVGCSHTDVRNWRHRAKKAVDTQKENVKERFRKLRELLTEATARETVMDGTRRLIQKKQLHAKYQDFAVLYYLRGLPSQAIRKALQLDPANYLRLEAETREQVCRGLE
jgi:DNA-directed RNA polymerase specialized sigma24 family protein